MGTQLFAHVVHLLWFDMNFFSCNSVSPFSCHSTLNSNNVKCGQYCTIQISSPKLKEAILTCGIIPNPGWQLKSKRATLHAENSSAIYKQLFKDLSGLKKWIDIFVRRGLLESKLILLSLLLPKNLNVCPTAHICTSMSFMRVVKTLFCSFIFSVKAVQNVLNRFPLCISPL